ncbi:MAG: hypothetical protein WD294_08540 [Phycisphaeraceae bacterium]
MSPFSYDDPSQDCRGYMRLIESQWPKANDAPDDELMALIERAVDKCPHLPELWMMRADLVALHLSQTRGKASPYRRDDVLQSLEAAARIRPDYIEAHEAVAEFCENELKDMPAAEAAYGRAIGLGGGPWVYTGLARVLARQGNLAQALAALDPEFCPYHDEPEVQQAQQLLHDGIYDL